MSKKEKREKDQEKNIPQQETACEEETEKQPEAETKAGDQEAAAEEAKSDPLEELQKELGRQKDLLLRTAAEYENFRRRSQKERENVYADAYAEALGEVMPMVDNLERALQCGEGEQLHKGLEMVMNQFQEMLKKLGIETFGEKGDTFDPNIHHAIMHEDNENLPENSIVEVFQRGYKKGERIIRCAMVKVAN